MASTPLQQTRSLRDEIGAAEDKLRRSTASGKSEDETVSARIDGQGHLTVEVDGEAFGLSDKRKLQLEKAVTQAANASLAKQRRRVSKELARLTVDA